MPSASPLDDLPRFAELGVAASVQFSHAPSDRDLAERFWPDELDGTYAFRSLIESGALVANGSDAPIEELDPWAGICAGVLRTLDEPPAWRPEQAVTLEQALAATIVAPAWLSGDERGRGTLAPRLSRRPRRARPRPARRASRTSSRGRRSSRRWSAAAGCTTRHPGAERVPDRTRGGAPAVRRRSRRLRRGAPGPSGPRLRRARRALRCRARRTRARDRTWHRPGDQAPAGPGSAGDGCRAQPGPGRLPDHCTRRRRDRA